MPLIITIQNSKSSAVSKIFFQKDRHLHRCLLDIDVIYHCFSVNSPYPISPKPRTRAPLVLHTLTNQISAEPAPKSINHNQYRKSSSLLPENRPIAKIRCCDLIRAIQLGKKILCFVLFKLIVINHELFA